MQRRQTRLRIGLGLVALAAVLALVAFMTMVSSNGTTSVSATNPTPTPGGGYKALAKVTLADLGPPVILTITKEGAQVIASEDKVLWDGQRWNVDARGASDVTLSAAKCKSDKAVTYPQDDKWIYEPAACVAGFLSGITDLEVFPGANALYHCIMRTDHDDTTDVLKVAGQCNTDVIGLGDPADVLANVSVPGEGADGVSGPPPPPPYSNLRPVDGAGAYYPGGHVDCGNLGTGTCATTTVCIEDFGAGTLGPNLLAKLVLADPDVTPNENFGTAFLYPKASIAQCDNLDITGLAIFGAPFPLGAFIPGTASETTWRTAAVSATNFDGDSCSDLEELDENNRLKGCGDDPYNPGDSTVGGADYSGSYAILVRVARAETTPGFGGAYFSCLADIQQDGTGKNTSTTTPGLTARVFCYQDSFSVINSLGSPGVTGDGYPGGGPPWGAIPANGAPEDIATECGRFGLAGTGPGTLDEDGDTVANDGCPSGGFGDVDSKQTELAGYVDNADNTLKFRGCFEDEDASGSLQNVYTEVSVNRNTGVGTADIWVLQGLTNCTDPHVWGTYVGDGGNIGPPVGAFDNAEVSIVRQPGGKTRDTDQDGIPNAVELRDNGATDCGLRDPFNPYDWYDVNQDGVIDLLNDILGVISHYSPGGAPPYNVNWDRPPSMTGGAGHWNRGAPDGVIDLLNDILGVISQYHPGAC